MKNFKIFSVVKILVFACIILSCDNNNTDSGLTPESNADLNSNQIILNSIDKIDNNTTANLIANQVSKFDIAKRLKNFSDFFIAYDEELEKNFIVFSAQDDFGNSIAVRQEVTLDYEKNVLTFPTNGFGESCTGVNCTKCGFATGGGCKCTGKAGDFTKPSYCNHTITKPDNNEQ